MQNLHDQIVSENKQDQFYSSIMVDHFNSILCMEGESSTLSPVINNAGLLRIVECRVKQDKAEHFEKVQKDIWKLEMKKVKGILGGSFSKSVNNTNKYLVSTFWNSRKNHNNYVNKILPELREKADVANDLDKITGKQILLVDSWKIIDDN
jgi:heme-degrading monooxygenase HmoA